MSEKTNSRENNASKTKKTKFTLDRVKLPKSTIEGVLFVAGAGDAGQLGLGPDVLENASPSLVNLSSKIIDIYAGGKHTVCLTWGGKVLTFGCNDDGALGRVTDGNKNAQFTAQKVKLPGKVIQISAGDSHTAALLSDGRVFAWGTFKDSHGNMGMTVKGNERLPYEILKNYHVVKIASGANHIVFLTKHGEIFTCGCAEQGQLGRISSRFATRRARGGIGKGNLAKFLNPGPISIKLTLNMHFDNIWAGMYCTFAKEAGTDNVYVFGLNNYNQIGLKSTDIEYFPRKSSELSNNKWDNISGGKHHTITLRNDGKVFVLGSKEDGRLEEDCQDAQALTEVTGLSDKKIVNIACGSSTSFAVSADGKLYAWGMGIIGQLGMDEEVHYFEPTQVEATLQKCLKVSCGENHMAMLCQYDKKKKRRN